MRFKLDENLSLEFAERIRREGLDVETVASEKIFGISDTSLIETCQQEGRCLITLDMDFANPIIFPPHLYAGIVVLRMRGSDNPIGELRRLIKTFVQALATESPVGKLWIVEAQRIRVYSPDD